MLGCDEFCENCSIDLTNDEVTGCPICAYKDYVRVLRGKAESYDHTSMRLEEAHKYCDVNLMPGSWWKNVWHAILDDLKDIRRRFGIAFGVVWALESDDFLDRLAYGLEHGNLGVGRIPCFIDRVWARRLLREYHKGAKSHVKKEQREAGK